MRNKKSVAVVIIALILLIGVLSFIARNNSLEKSLLLSPSEDGTIDETALETLKGSLIEEIEKVKADDSLLARNQEKLNNLLSVETGENYEMIVRRFIENPSDFPSAVTRPVKLNVEDYDISVTLEESITETGIESVNTIFELVDKDGPLEGRERLKLYFINDDSYEINISSIFSSEVYQMDNQAYAVISASDSIESEVSRSPLTGYQVSSLPVPTAVPLPYNRVDRDFAVIIPYNNNFPLPSNAVSYLDALFPSVAQYFLESSESTARYTFTVYPVNVPNYSPQNIQINNVISAADQAINYGQYDMALILAPFSSIGGGGAYMQVTSQGTIAHFNTNDLPLISAVSVVYFNPSDPDPTRQTERTIEHEMGHVLTAFNPFLNVISYWGGLLPHARGFPSASGKYPCPSNGAIIDCSPDENGDELEVMGIGQGLFSQHSAVYDLGFRSLSSVQSVSASGTYTLCPSNRGIANCPKELLIENPNGADLALEYIQAPLGSRYSLYQNCQQLYQPFFDSIILRAVDIELGSGLGNILYRGNEGGDVIYPASSALSPCIGPNGSPLIDFPLHPFQSVTTPIGTITFQSFVNNQATILLNYNVPSCATGPPQVSLTEVYQGGGPLQVFQHNLQPINFRGSRALRIRGSSTCATQQDYVRFTTSVAVGYTGYISSSQIIPLPRNQDILYQGLNLPLELLNPSNVPPGIYDMTITVDSLNAPTGQGTTTIAGQLEIVPYNPPSFFTIFPTSFCSDLDTTYYPPEYFGTNFRSRYPNIGGIARPNPPIQGLPSVAYLPDLCTWDNGVHKANDFICSNNIPEAPPNYGIVTLKDCRLEMNNQNAYCYNGVCY